MAHNAALEIPADLEDRAIRAYATRQRRAGEVILKPLSTSSVIHDGRLYLALEDEDDDPFAVYRVKDDGHKEHVDREYWPSCLLPDWYV